MRRLSPDVRQHDTHKQLVRRPARPSVRFGAGNLDAIVVPASRPAANLDHAVTLARAAGSHLVVLCSRNAKAGDVEELLAARTFDRAVVIELRDGDSYPLLDFSTSRAVKADLPGACALYSTDLSIKRNIGLLLARMLGWEHIFYMDDDIRDISYPDLCRTVSMLGPFRSAGMQVVEFPDNSAVCHAHRATGAFQDVFVSGSALAVDSSGDMGFFPDIYNEDWLFFYNDVANGKLASSGLNATQLRYNPFAEPQRAAWQEFGDVLAEGLYALLHQRGGAADATRDYWAYFLKERQSFLQAIIDRSGEATAEIRPSMLAAVQKALETSMQIQPEVCQRYVTLWQQDLCHWKQQLADLPRGLPLERALKELGLRSCPDGVRAGAARPGREGMPGSTSPGPAAIPSVPTLGRSWNEAGMPVPAGSGSPAAEPWRGLPRMVLNLRPRRRTARSMVPAGAGQDTEPAGAGQGPAAATTPRP